MIKHPYKHIYHRDQKGEVKTSRFFLTSLKKNFILEPKRFLLFFFTTKLDYLLNNIEQSRTFENDPIFL